MPTIYIIKFKKHNNMSQIKDLQLTINDATQRYNSQLPGYRTHMFETINCCKE